MQMIKLFSKARQTEKYSHPQWKGKISLVDFSILIARLVYVSDPSWVC